jgi:PAS domain S-box-containing protein
MIALSHQCALAFERERLYESQSLLASIVDSSEDAIFSLATDGTVLSWNKGAERTFGYSAGEVIGQNVAFLFPPELLGELDDAEAKVETGQSIEDLETVRIRKDGRPIDVSTTVSLLRDKSNGVIGVSVIARDITRRRREAEVRELLAETGGMLASTLDYRATLLIIPTLVVPRFADWCKVHLVGVDGRIRMLAGDHANPMKVELLKELDNLYAANDYNGKGPAAAIRSRKSILIEDRENEWTSDDSLDPECGRLEEKLAPRSVIVVPLVARGKVLGSIEFGVSDSGRRYSTADLAPAEQIAERAANAIDVASLYAAEQIARKQAEAAVKSRDDFIAIASHELNTPLTNLRGYAQLEMLRIRRTGTVDSDTIQRALTVIDQQSTRLANLVSRLLDAAVLNLEPVDLERAKTDLVALVEENINQYQGMLSRHVIVLNAQAGILVSIDRLRMEAVLTNLLENAVRYSPNGGVIAVDVNRADNATARIAIRDEGTGVPLDRRSHLFERFYQADKENHRSGLGLGLYVSQKIVRLHGGDIVVEFPLDGGTRMVVTLPTVETAEA